MRLLLTTWLATLAIALIHAWLPLGVAHAQANCLTFGQARQAGLFAKFNLRPAGQVKRNVEAQTGGKVVAFLICRPGPVYNLKVLKPGGVVEDVTVPAR